MSIRAHIAALRQAGYAGPVDYLGFADSGDRAADMTRNYWAGREARQKEEQPMTEADRLRDEQLHVDWNLGGALDRYHELGRQIGAALQAEAADTGGRPYPPWTLTDGRVVELGPYGPITDDLDREQTEAWLAEDRERAAQGAADSERDLTPDEIGELYVEAGLRTGPERDYEAGG